MVGVGQVAASAGQSFGKGISLTPDGCPVTLSSASGSAVTPSDRYSYGVGVVMYQSDDLFQLVGFGVPTTTALSTWRAIKRLYR